MDTIDRLKLSVVIPAYNEEKNLPRTLDKLREVLSQNSIPYEILVVNDNSTDRTRNVIKNYIEMDENIRTINRSPPGGFGRAVRAGLTMVTGDMVVLYMSDMSDDPDDLLLYYKKLVKDMIAFLAPVLCPAEDRRVSFC